MSDADKKLTPERCKELIEKPKLDEEVKKATKEAQELTEKEVPGFFSLGNWFTWSYWQPTEAEKTRADCVEILKMAAESDASAATNAAAGATAATNTANPAANAAANNAANGDSAAKNAANGASADNNTANGAHAANNAAATATAAAAETAVNNAVNGAPAAASFVPSKTPTMEIMPRTGGRRYSRKSKKLNNPYGINYV